MKTTRTEKRAPIPTKTRQALWIAAAGRCEFRGCNKPVSRDFLTKRTANVAELAHIIADSPAGARGAEGESERLAKELSNLMLACFDCHARIDRHGKSNEYTVDELRAMKREHEQRVERIYSATGVKDSLPILMSFPVGTHLPVLDIHDVCYAMLANSKHTRFPLARYIQIDRSDFDILDDSPDFWPRAEAALERLFESQVLPALTSKDAPTHLTVAAFAPIPLLMKLGAMLGNKMDASVLDLPNDLWLWDTSDSLVAPEFLYSVPDSLPAEVNVLVSISNRAVDPKNGRESLEFRAAEPNRGIIRTEAHLQDFRRKFDDFLMRLVRSGVRVLHVYPATPLSASVEVGRILLPKTLEAIHVWDWRSPSWRPAVRLN